MAHFNEWENPRDSHRYLSTNQLLTPIAILASLVAPTEAYVCVTEEFHGHYDLERAHRFWISISLVSGPAAGRCP